MKIKKLLLSLLLVICFGFTAALVTSCDDVNNNSSVTETSYYGTWNAVNVTIDGVSFTIEELEATGDYSLSDFRIEIKEDGKAYVYSEGSGAWFVYELTDNGIKIGVRECLLIDGKLAVENNGITIYLIKTSDSHVHEWNEIETIEASCTEDGKITFSCSDCNEIKFEKISAKGHAEVIDAAVEATCTTTGLTEGTHCSTCNEVLLEQKVVPALHHNYQVSEHLDATCEHNGYTTYVCSNDSTHTYTDTHKATGHTEVMDNAVNPTCATTGLTEGTHCSTCNEVLLEQKVVPALHHNYQVSEHLDATCENNGYTTYVCSNDSTHTYTDTHKATGHTEVMDAAVNPTCTTTGLTEGTHCSTCNKILVAQTEVAISHNYDNYVCVDCDYHFYTEGLTFRLSSDETYYLVGGYTGTDLEVVIPSVYNSKPVRSVGDYAFYECSSLTSITIPDSVTSIGNCAFYNCSSLSSITIPDNVTTIGWCAFYNCGSLSSITIPDNVTTIGDSTFWGCSSLTNVTIGNSVTSIGENAFYFCTSLTSIVIPDSVISIGDYAFLYCSSLTNVTIGNSVTSIGENAFEDCRSLTSVTIGNNVTSIGRYAFSGCTSLTNITIPDSVITFGWRVFHNCNSLKYNTFDNGLYLGNDSNPYVVFMSAYSTTITTCKINAFTKILYTEAFYRCSSLTTIEIPDSVTNIGGQAFMQCYSLKSITIPISMTSIAGEAFLYCYALSNVYYKGTETQWKNIAGNGKSDLTNATIYFTDSYTEGLEFTLLEDGESYSVSGYSGIDTDVIIPAIHNNKPVTSIGDCAFWNCTSLTSITIPDSVISIGDYAFYNCGSLSSITIPDNVTTIGDSTFWGCSSLTNVTIGNSVTSIGENAFYFCTSLTSIVIPDSVISIGDYAFDDCSSLTTVYYAGTAEQWNNISGISTSGLNKLGLIIYYKYKK